MKKSATLILIILIAAATVSFAKTELPLKQVVLFNSGVGYFECAAAVTDKETAELTFKTDQINDVIKSLILLDESGGQISAITYDSRDPVDRTLKSFRIDLTDNPSREQLLNRMRGIMVRVKTSGEDVEGRILGVEEKKQVKDEIVFTEEILNLMAKDGIHALSLNDMQKIEILDDKTSQDLQKALGILAESLDKDKKGVRLTFDGKGERNVRVGYMLETPVWKTSYRLMIREKDLFLQGWAHVENTTDNDWNQVKLSLVAGRPLSFIQNLYEPLYIQRPVVQTETYGAIVPPAYEGELAGGAERQEQKAYSRRAAGAVNRMMMAEAPAPAAGIMASDFAEMAPESQAATREAGELFEYAIKDPITLPRQQSAMIPIADESIKGEPLSIFNESVNAKHPLNGVELENTSKLHLMHGPVTVFEGGIYAGDAQLSDTQPGEKKLISYALDLASDANTERENEPEEIVSLKIVHGAMLLQQKYVSVTKYILKNKRDVKRTILVEHPVMPGWDLIEPKEAGEKTAALYRFRVSTEPNKSETLAVKQQRFGQQTVMLSNLDNRNIDLYLKQKAITPKVKEALKKLGAMQLALTTLRNQRETLERRRNDIANDQNRIRENMKTVARNSDSYSRWERKLTQQEEEMDQIATEHEKLIADEQSQQEAVNKFLAELTVE